MGAQSLSTTATVIDRRTGAEDWLRLTLFSAADGMLDGLERLSRRSAAMTTTLDLFDEAHLTLETRNDGRTWFVREVDLVRRRSRLAGSYPALREACRLARVVSRNPVPEESREPVYELLHRALDAWESGARPDAVYFKSLFVLTRDEGYPVRAAWHARLQAGDRAAVDSILRLPAAEQTVSVADVTRLSAALEAYLRAEADFQIDD